MPDSQLVDTFLPPQKGAGHGFFALLTDSGIDQNQTSRQRIKSYCSQGY
jgi:hypothetical protein